MKQYFLLLFIFAFHSTLSSLGQLACGTITVDGLKIPIASSDPQLEWEVPQVSSFGERFEKKNLAVLSPEFHKKYVIPMQNIFGIPDPVICVKTKADDQVERIVYKKEEKTCHVILMREHDPEVFTMARGMVKLYLNNKYGLCRKTFSFGPLLAKTLALFYSCLFFMTKALDCLFQFAHLNEKAGYLSTTIAIFATCFLLIKSANYYSCYQRKEERFCDIKALMYLARLEGSEAIVNETRAHFEKETAERDQVIQKKTVFSSLFEKCMNRILIDPMPSVEGRIVKLKNGINPNLYDVFNQNLGNDETELVRYYKTFLADPRKWCLAKIKKIFK